MAQIDEDTVRSLALPRKFLLKNLGEIKNNLISKIEHGDRDYAGVRHTVEQYITYQRACDLLGGYEVRPDAAS